MELHCESCAISFSAKQKSARFCSDKCRKRAARRTGPISLVTDETPAPKTAKKSSPVSTLVGEIHKTLTDANLLESANGQLALRIAERIENAGNDSGSSVAALSKELRQVMAELLTKVVVADDPIDELSRRREARRSS